MRAEMGDVNEDQNGKHTWEPKWEEGMNEGQNVPI